MRRHAERLCATAVVAVTLAVGSGPVVGQQAASAPAVRIRDVESMDAIIAALYDVISGPAGQVRDWDRFHSLFIPGARLIPTRRAPDGQVRHAVQTPEQYRGGSGRMLEERGFFEREIGRTTERFGNIAHVFSAYDSRATADGEVFARGINSIQLLYDGTRWWVVSVFWDFETPANPIPAKYLNRSGN